MTKRDQVKRLLVHYFTLAGAVNDADNTAEINDIVDLMMDGVKEELTKAPPEQVVQPADSETEPVRVFRNLIAFASQFAERGQTPADEGRLVDLEIDGVTVQKMVDDARKVVASMDGGCRYEHLLCENCEEPTVMHSPQGMVCVSCGTIQGTDRRVSDDEIDALIG